MGDDIAATTYTREQRQADRAGVHQEGTRVEREQESRQQHASQRDAEQPGHQVLEQRALADLATADERVDARSVQRQFSHERTSGEQV